MEHEAARVCTMLEVSCLRFIGGLSSLYRRRGLLMSAARPTLGAHVLPKAGRDLVDWSNIREILRLLSNVRRLSAWK